MCIRDSVVGDLHPAIADFEIGVVILAFGKPGDGIDEQHGALVIGKTKFPVQVLLVNFPAVELFE